MKLTLVLVRTPANPKAWFLRDIIKLIAEGARSLGHDVHVVENRLETGRVHLLFAAQWMHPEAAAQIRKHRVPYAVFQSEVLGDGHVNQVHLGRVFDEVVLPNLRGALVVWEGLRGQLAWYREQGIAARWFEPGFHEALAEVAPAPHKDIDFLFYGSTTENRARVFDALRARGHQVVQVFDPIPYFRNELIGRTKVHLIPRQSDAMPQLPYWRIVYQLHNTGVPLVERCTDQAWLEDCFLTADPEDYVQACLDTVTRPDLEDVGETLRRRFRARPVVERLAPLLRDLAERVG